MEKTICIWSFFRCASRSSALRLYESFIQFHFFHLTWSRIFYHVCLMLDTYWCDTFFVWKYCTGDKNCGSRLSSSLDSIPLSIRVLSFFRFMGVIVFFLLTRSGRDSTKKKSTPNVVTFATRTFIHFWLYINILPLEFMTIPVEVARTFASRESDLREQTPAMVNVWLLNGTHRWK